MNQPKSYPKAYRLLKYFISSFKLINIIENWPTVPLGAFGVISFKKGRILRLRNGLRFKAKDFMDAWIIKEVFASNEYKIKSSLRQATVIDIGANIGAFSILAALKMQKAKIYSYEPGSMAFDQLNENILLNGMERQIIPFKLAVYKGKGKIKLYELGKTGLSSIYKSREERKFETIKTVTLEDIFLDNKIKVCNYLKIDCEGAEYDILAYCPGYILKRVKTVALEFHEMNSKQNHHDLINILKDNGFRLTHRYNDIENKIGYIYAKR
ncbi:FkbM family methyltransferase [Patescibacteria group bacterium]|nr:FkbM family methyltransferase [Patescibacteria group bacterium]